MSSTFGWVQNPNRLEKLKYITGVMLKGSYSNTEMLDRRLRVLLNYKFITKTDYDVFVTELSQLHIDNQMKNIQSQRWNNDKS